MINNYRYGAYALLAIGLINLRYQTGSANNFNNSSVLIGLGLIGLLLTIIPTSKKHLSKPAVKNSALVIFIAAILYGFII
jgi:hypothetical protein